MNYAVLNNSDICVGFSMVSRPIIADTHIEIQEIDDQLKWRKYDRENQTWSTEKYEPETTAPLSEFEQLKAQNEELKSKNDALEAWLLDLTQIVMPVDTEV